MHNGSHASARSHHTTIYINYIYLVTHTFYTYKPIIKSLITNSYHCLSILMIDVCLILVIHIDMMPIYLLILMQIIATVYIYNYQCYRVIMITQSWDPSTFL